MKVWIISACLFLLAGAVGQQNASSSRGTIFGIVVGQDGKRVRSIGVTATPLGVALGAVLPHTQTNTNGEYRFENLPWWGRYTVYAEDEEAGYSSFSTGPAGNAHPPEVRITPDHPEAEFNVQLPPRAGFLRIRLVDSKTGSIIPGMAIRLESTNNPDEIVFSESCSSTHTILIRPGKSFLLHVTSTGYREWNETTGRGKAIFLNSGDRLTLDVELRASD